MKRIIVTGGAGFIGSALIRELYRRDKLEACQITVLDNLSTGRGGRLDPFREAGGGKFRFVYGDTGDGQAWSKCGEAEEIYHLADIVGIERVTGHPSLTATKAVDGAKNAVRHSIYSGAKLFYASTSMIYGPGSPDTEEDLAPAFGNHPIWAYAAAKLIGEHIVRDAQRAHGLRAIIGRFFNVVGPGQDKGSGHVVPKLIDQALRGDRLTIYGTGQQRRSFIHVDDAAVAVCLLMEKLNAIPEEKRTVNITAGAPAITIQALAKIISEAAGSPARKILMKCAPGLDNTKTRQATGLRIREILGDEWRPESYPGEIIRAIVWEEKHPNLKGIIPEAGKRK